jgi:hypothetical protein
VLFIDEDQQVTLNDIRTLDEVCKWAGELDADMLDRALSSQFMCNGSDGYLAWMDHMLQIRETTHNSLEDIDYDFKVLIFIFSYFIFLYLPISVKTIIL